MLPVSPVASICFGATTAEPRTTTWLRATWPRWSFQVSQPKRHSPGGAVRLVIVTVYDLVSPGFRFSFFGLMSSLYPPGFLKLTLYTLGLLPTFVT